MAHCDANIVVASMEVEIGVDFRTAHVGEEFGDEWDQVPILLCDFVEVPEVDTELQGAILLLSKEDLCPTW